MQNFEEEGEQLLHDRNTIAGITTILAEDPERVRIAMQTAGRSKALRRYAHIKQGDDDVVRNIAKASMRDKLRIKRAAENAGNVRVQSGTLCILVAPNGFGKKVFYPVKEKYEDYERVDLNENYGYLSVKHGGRTNKYSERIVQKKLQGEFIFFRKAATEENPLAVTDLTVEEFEVLFPKIVTWKNKTK